MIICLGTTPTIQRTMVFDRLVLDQVNRAAQSLRTASGKSVNVAKILHTLGHQVLAIGVLGGDTGQFIRRELDGMGVQHQFIELTARTRTCTTVIDRAGATITELVEESPGVEEGTAEKLVAALGEQLSQAKALVLSGSLAPGVPKDFYACCVQMAAEREVPVVLDASGEPLQLALASGPLVVKPNRGELAATVGVNVETEAGLREAMGKLVDQGPKWVVVTMGAQGAMVSDGQSFWRVEAPRVQAVNPIGSGDAFAAGLTVGIVSGQSIPEACALGAACGAANALTLTSGSVQVQDVQRLQAQLRVERIG